MTLYNLKLKYNLWLTISIKSIFFVLMSISISIRVLRVGFWMFSFFIGTTRTTPRRSRKPSQRRFDAFLVITSVALFARNHIATRPAGFAKISTFFKLLRADWTKARKKLTLYHTPHSHWHPLTCRSVPLQLRLRCPNRAPPPRPLPLLQKFAGAFLQAVDWAAILVSLFLFYIYHRTSLL